MSVKRKISLRIGIGAALVGSIFLTSLLTAYFRAVTQILQKHGAMIDKFIGDAVNLAIRLGSLN